MATQMEHTREVAISFTPGELQQALKADQYLARWGMDGTTAQALQRWREMHQQALEMDRGWQSIGAAGGRR